MAYTPNHLLFKIAFVYMYKQVKAHMLVHRSPITA